MRFKSVFGSIVMVLLGCVGAQAADGDKWQETQQGRKFWFRVVSERDATAFYNCPMLEKVVLPGHLASIGEGAFAGCVRLGNFALPPSVSSIGDGAFTLCSSITAFEVAADNKTFVARDGVLYRGTKLLQYPLAKSVTRYVIPYGTTAIGAEAFYGSPKLEELHVPGTVRTVGDFFAAKCKVLTDVYLHWNLETMPKTLYQNFSRWDGDDGLLTLHVPVGWSYLYTGAQFSNFGKVVEWDADLSVMPRSGGYAPLYVKKFQCFYANPKNKNLKFDEEKSIFVDTTNPSARFSAYLEINRRHPNIWIGGRQITAPYIYDGQTPKAGYCHFDFRFNEFTFNNFRCVTDNGPALLYKIENNMSDENYYAPVFHFKGTNTLAGSSAGIMVGINYDTEYEAYPSTEFVMDSEGASATLNINATNGHAIYFTTPDWSQLAFEDLDITLKGQGAIGASGNAMEIYLENCNLSAYNTSDGTDSTTGAPVPTIGYFDEFELSDCSFTQAGVHYDSSLGCVADASGAPITGTVLIRRDSESGTSEQPYGQTLDVVLRDRMSSSEMSTLEQAGLFLVERHLDVNGYMGNATTRYNTYYRKSDHKELFSAKEVFDGNTTYYLAADVETKDVIHIDITASDRDMVNMMYGADVTDLLSHYDHVRLLFAVPNAIEGVTVARPCTDSTFYMLDGRRTQGLPKKPGIYVHDGKKVLLR